jgi:hypothetical protein
MKKSNRQPDSHNAGYYELVLYSIDDYAVFTTDKRGFVNTWNTGAQQVRAIRPKRSTAKMPLSSLHPPTSKKTMIKRNSGMRKSMAAL